MYQVINNFVWFTLQECKLLLMPHTVRGWLHGFKHSLPGLIIQAMLEFL